jgi:isochorismate hydrolase
MQISVPDHKILSRVALPAGKTALLLSDLLIDFVSPKGKLFVPETRKTIVPIRSLLGKARKSGVMIVYIQDWHRPDDPEFSIWGPHAVQDTRGIAIIPELVPAPEDFIVRKRTYDPFFSTDLDLLLRQKRIQNLVITGLPSCRSPRYHFRSQSFRFPGGSAPDFFRLPGKANPLRRDFLPEKVMVDKGKGPFPP